jgi:electron transport complex protein RnfE
MNMFKEFWKGIKDENPIFKLALGLCPTLAVTSSIENAVGMGAATSFVLICSNIIISIFRNVIPDKVRIPAFIVIIATFVTLVDLVMKGYLPALSERLSIFIPLIVVNCIILGRAEVFASKEPILGSLFDALGMGAGFTLSLVLIGGIRELLGNGEIVFAGTRLVATGAEPIITMILAPGAFLTAGLLMALFNYLGQMRKGESA